MDRQTMSLRAAKLNLLNECVTSGLQSAVNFQSRPISRRYIIKARAWSGPAGRHGEL